jgi:hypothetical protein
VPPFAVTGDRKTNVYELKLGENRARKGREHVWEGTGRCYGDGAAQGFASAHEDAQVSQRAPVGHPTRFNQQSMASLYLT